MQKILEKTDIDKKDLLSSTMVLAIINKTELEFRNNFV